MTTGGTNSSIIGASRAHDYREHLHEHRTGQDREEAERGYTASLLKSLDTPYLTELYFRTSTASLRHNGPGRIPREPDMITQDQKSFFHTFGYLFLPRLFNEEEMAVISERFDHWLDAERDDAPFPGESRQSLYSIAELEPRFTDLVADDRIYNTVEALLGEGFLWLCSEGNLHVGDTQWHPDGTRLNYRPMKVHLYLDPLTADAGCLRVIPGSHRLPYHDDVRPIAQSDRPGTEIPSCLVESKPGDVLFADMNTWHASFGGHVGRRQLALNFVPEPTSEVHVQMMKDNYDGVLRNIENLQYSQPGRAFTDAFLQSENPRISRLASKWVELGLE